MEAETDSGCEDDVLTHSDGLVNITEEHNGHTDTERNREINLPTTDKGLRRNSSGYQSHPSECPALRKHSAFTHYKLPEFSHVRSKVDTGLGFKRPASISGSHLREAPKTSGHTSGNKQKRSDPLPPTQSRKNATASFKVPELPAQASHLTRNSQHRRSLTRLFSRNTQDKTRDTKTNGIKTPFGDVNKASNYCGDEKRSQFSSKRSITSLSLFNSSKKDEEHHQSSEVQHSNKERKNSLGRLRARSSLDLSSLGFGSISRASSKAGLTDLKEEADNIKTANKTSVPPRKSDRPWFDLTRVWRDQTKDLPVEEMFHKVGPAMWASSTWRVLDVFTNFLFILFL